MPKQKGAISQRQLIKVLVPLIDAAMSKAPSRGRDEARRMIREVLTASNWKTVYVLRNLTSRRCRYLSKMGYIIEAKYLRNFELAARMEHWYGREITR